MLVVKEISEDDLKTFNVNLSLNRNEHSDFMLGYFDKGTELVGTIGIVVEEVETVDENGNLNNNGMVDIKINNLYVKSSFRRKGIAYSLIITMMTNIYDKYDRIGRIYTDTNDCESLEKTVAKAGFVKRADSLSDYEIIVRRLSKRQI